MLNIMLDPQYLFLFVLIVTFSAFAQGFMGLGFGIIAMAGVAFTPWDLERASVVLNLLFVVLNGTIIYAGRKDFRINWKLVGVILLGEIAGVPVGYWFIFSFGDQPVFRLTLGVVLIAFAAYELFRPRIKKKLNMALGVVAGLTGGFLAGAFSSGGPPLALFIYSRHKNAADAKGTLQVVFLAATLWRVFTIVTFGGGISIQILKIAGMSFPLAVLFTWLGHLLTRRVSGEVFVKVVYTFIGIAGLMNIL